MLTRTANLLLITLCLTFSANLNAEEVFVESDDGETAAAQSTESPEEAPESAAAPATKAAPAPMVAETTATTASSERDEDLSQRIRDMVKRLDSADRAGKNLPVKAIERAIRAEFMRRTEGKTKISWLPGRLREADILVAQDNLELLLSYSERILTQMKPNKKYSKKEEEELLCMAAKGVIDQYNSPRRGSRGLASFGGPSQGLSAAGKNEIQRRRRLVGGMVAGEDYKPLTIKKIEDIGKAYKQTLLGAVKEYETMAVAINGKSSSSAAPGKTPAKKNKKK